MSRELYKAFSGKNPGFAEVSDGRGGAELQSSELQARDQIVIDELSTHTDIGRQEAIHPYKVRVRVDHHVRR